ncbi:MAG: aldehyde:ferredoxin oxidoreductase [Candidatus Thorarchaeota archaeon]|nr:aldehyde:ferredoxin oxidoreductase [Candidatus Thorarchaeota archaeon]
MTGRVLHIDLSARTSHVQDREELFQKWIGGVGVASQLLLENCPPGTAYADSPIILATGPFNMYYPCCAKTVAMFKSPLTGDLGESYAGGKLSMGMRLAGHDAVIITGRLSQPHYLLIQDDHVEFRDAHALWGLSARATGRILKEKAPGEGRRSILRIGVAGENQVRYAMVVVDTVRHFGRLGLGCVMGAKMLKGIVITGTHSYVVPSVKDYREMYRRVYDLVLKTGRMDKYDILGTSKNVLALNELRGLPTRNFSSSHFEGAEGISGERFADEVLVGKHSCVPCPIGCIHIGMLRVQFDPQRRDYGTVYVPYDYEPIFALGSNLGIGNTSDLLQLIERADMLGLDAMSVGGVLGWATEAFNKGVITARDLAGLSPRWGDVEDFLKMMDYIASPPNEFYTVAGRGVKALGDRYGGSEFAVHFNGNEAAGYHTGPASLVGQLAGLRHSHLDNAGYSLDEKALASPMTPTQIGQAIAKEDNWRAILNSLVICLFARPVFTPDVVIDSFRAIGQERTLEELSRVAELTFEARMRFKVQQGFDISRLEPPPRLLERLSPHGHIDKKDVTEAIGAWQKAHKMA